MKGIIHSLAFFSFILCAACSSVSGPRSGWRSAQAGYFGAMGIEEAWALASSSTIKIGIVDGGFDRLHPALKGRIDSIYEYPDAMHPGDMLTLAHGTIAASIIGADPEAPGGMAGVCPSCRILGASTGIIDHWTIKDRKEFFRLDPSASAADYQASLKTRQAEKAAFDKKWLSYVAASVSWSIKRLTDGGAKVISMSLMLAGLQGIDLAAVEEAMAYAKSRDVLIVMGAGNSAGYTSAYPGAGPEVLVAGCSSGNGPWRSTDTFKGSQRAYGTDYGPGLDVLAPCENIIVANPHDPATYRSKDGPRGAYDTPFSGEYEAFPQGGTSISVPFVSGLAALLRAAAPKLTAAQAADIIRRSSDDLGMPGRDDLTGWGRINYQKALYQTRNEQ